MARRLDTRAYPPDREARGPHQRPVLRPPDQTPRPGSAIRRRLFVVVVLVSAVIVMLRRTPDEMAHRLPGNLGDSALVMWILSWGAHGLVHDPLNVFNAGIYWPYPHTLAYADSLLSIAPVYGVLHALTGNWTLSWNILWFGLIGLNLGATYSLTRWLTGRTDAGLFAAFAAGFSAFVLGQSSHPQLEVIGFVPLGFLFLFKMLENPRLRYALGVGVVNVIVVFGSLYVAVGYTISVAIILVGFAIIARGRIPRRLVACLILAGAVSLLAAPSLIPYRAVEQTFPKRELVPKWGMRPRDIVRPSVGSYLYKYLSRNTDPGSGERHLFAGFSTMTLAGVGLLDLLVGRRRHRLGAHGPSSPVDEIHQRKKFLVLLVVVGAVVGSLAVGALGSGLVTPWRVAYDFVGPLSGVRVPARLAVISILCGAVLAGAGLAAITRRLPWPAVRVAVAAAACLLVLAELAAPVTYTTLPQTPDLLAVYRAFSHQPAGAAVELPIYNPATDPLDWALGEPSRMVWSTIDHHPRVNGYSGYFSPTYTTDTATIALLPAATAWDRLSAMRVRYLILHIGVQTGIGMYTEAQANGIVAALPAGASAVRYGPNILVDLHPSQKP